MWDLFYKTRLLKYVHHEQYPTIRKTFNKVSAEKKLKHLCNKGYLEECENGKVFVATDEVLPILQELKEYNTNLLPKDKPVGKGDINEILNTEAFIQAVKLPDFYTLLYPTEFRDSHDLIPDALLVLKSKEERKYKLIFLEVEAKKPKWVEKLAGKRENYVLLSKDYRFYDYWKTTSEKIGLAIPDVSNLKFSVNFICSIKENFGNGFHFTQSLTN
ncbi:MAG: hypothetical protein IPM96_20390 [Ignavibacteria bacterium]|nr:hypothetical protein [Ignavibacteria bacterium]